MNKTELVAAIADKSEMTKVDVEKTLKAFEEVITETLVFGEKIQLIGFMSYETVNVQERNCRNPKDGTAIIVPKHRKVKVKVGKSLKDAVVRTEREVM